MSETNENGNSQKLLYLAIAALMSIGGVSFKLVLDRMDKQEATASANISALREEIKTAKSDAKDAVAAAASASKDAVAATALALKEAVVATASALKDSVNSSASSSRDTVTATAGELSDKIELLRRRVEKLEERESSLRGTAK